MLSFPCGHPGQFGRNYTTHITRISASAWNSSCTDVLNRTSRRRNGIPNCVGTDTVSTLFDGRCYHICIKCSASNALHQILRNVFESNSGLTNNKERTTDKSEKVEPNGRRTMKNARRPLGSSWYLKMPRVTRSPEGRESCFLSWNRSPAAGGPRCRRCQVCSTTTTNPTAATKLSVTQSGWQRCANRRKNSRETLNRQLELLVFQIMNTENTKNQAPYFSILLQGDTCA